MTEELKPLSELRARIRAETEPPRPQGPDTYQRSDGSIEILPPAATLSLRPISTEDWMKLSHRERQLNAIGDVIAYWIKWVTRQHDAENLTVTADTHIVLPGENAPPHWPSIGQLGRWLEVLRDSDASLAEDPQGLSPEGVAARAAGIAKNPMDSVS